MIKGIDVSHHNGSIDWAKVKADGVDFAFIKATQGVGYSKVDYFRNNAPVALGNGINVGAYHYAVFSSVPEALAEAKYFYSVIKDYKLNYPVVLDLEENKKKASKKQLTDAAIAFMDFLKSKGYTAMLYTGKSFLESQLEESRIQYPLWIARYNTSLGRDAAIWQYSSSGKVNGIFGNVDMNWAYGDFAYKKVNKVGEIKYIYTGGYAGPALNKIHDYLFKRGHGFECKRGPDGSVIFLVGPFDTSQSNWKEAYDSIIKIDPGMKLYNPGQAADWRK